MIASEIINCLELFLVLNKKNKNYIIPNHDFYLNLNCPNILETFLRFMNILIITSFCDSCPVTNFFLHLIVKCYGNQYRVVNKDTQSWSSYRASVFMVKYRYITYTKYPGL